MKIFLAGTRSCEQIRSNSLYCLDSFVEVKDNEVSDCHNFEDYMLDSGLFTYMNSKGDSAHNIDWYAYADRYAAYVKRNNIKKYVELDCDAFMSYDRVKKLREYLELKVGWQCMPAWHMSRGKDDFVETAKNYKWFCIGGIVTAGAKNAAIMKRLFPYLIDEAHRHGAKVHGLGFTKTTLLPTFHFDSVDSTSWLAFAQYGSAYQFDGKKMTSISKPDNALVRDFTVDASQHNMPKGSYKHYLQGLEWIKYQKYAKEHL